MSNRVIRDWTDSEKINQLSAQAEVFLIRLMMKADDYGSFHANIKLLKPILFPLKVDTIREADISRWIAECEKTGLIFLYTVAGKTYLRIINFGQRMRSMKKRFPDVPEQECGESRRVAADCQPEGKGIETGIEDEGKGNPPENLGELISNVEDELLGNQIQMERICMNTGKSLDQAKISLRKYHLFLQEKEMYPKSRRSVLAGFEKWLMSDFKEKSKGFGDWKDGLTEREIKNRLATG